ncbi:sensory box histidine kinase / response regulator [Desulforapulum autotrophicum HRM2]|uniref:histidine kinase n=2 Tax=Desulforapulum autotrophicum TaxID=2296 RepID=C0QM62_DESAH|nr:sensory box histidine kinase / response regulator [Desulforapulum autotrophicum HRM2]
MPPLAGEAGTMTDKPTYQALEARIGQLEKEVAEKETLSAQLQQAQRMEAVGTLAGEIANDFNNILQGISGYTEILLQGKEPDNPDFPNLTAIYKAAERGTRLIRQLLSFSHGVTARKEQTAKADALLEKNTSPLGGRETILVVDDEKSIIDMVGTILNQFGYQVLTAANGREALERHRQLSRKIDLVILDIGMPEMGGQECLQELLKLDPHTRVVFTSGYLNDASIAELMKSGAMGYIGKPYKVTDFLQSIRTVLDKERPYFQES